MFDNHLNPVIWYLFGIALTKYAHMSTHVPGFQSFFMFLHHLILAKLAASSIRPDVHYFQVLCKQTILHKVDLQLQTNGIMYIRV